MKFVGGATFRGRHVVRDGDCSTNGRMTLTRAFATLITAATLVAGCSSAPANTPRPAGSDDQFRARINAFVDEWHQDAAHARPAYFDKIASDGIYIGTDKTERWTREAFRTWAQPAFARPVAWAFTPLHRHVNFTPNRQMIWFDEQVRSSMGLLQASGVMRPTPASFEIVHYQLSIAVPNEVIPEVTGAIKAFESK
jgi:hypothetical protein